MTQATYTRTAHIALDDLNPFPGNAKRGKVDTILASLRRNGQYRSLVVREEPGGRLVVLAGNHTMQALAAHGPGDCGSTVKAGRGSRPCGICQNDPTWEPGARCEIVTCDDDTALRVNVVDNRAADLGSYDYEALSELLAGLDDLDGTGYTPQDVEDITALLTAPPDEVGQLADQHGQPNEDVFRPQIKLVVDAATFDRWRVALDAHQGKDDEAKLAGLLDEIEATRDEAAGVSGFAGLDQPFKALCSFAFWKPKDMRDFAGKLATPESWIFGDSGAHSARTMGIHLTLEDYATWCRKWDQQLTLYANLDVIGGPEATWRNQKELELVHGLEPIPVFHTGDPWSYLERYIDEGYTYIALGKLLGNPVKEVLPWLAKAFQIADGRAVFHGFGMTVWRALREFPFYSVDSSTWGSGFRFGVIKLFDPDTGQWINFAMRDRDSLLRHRELVRAHHTDPMVLATHATYDRAAVTVMAAVAWRRLEEYIRARHGPITIPPGPHNPVTRGGPRPAPPGLHLYLAEATTTNLYRAAAGVQAARHKETAPS